MTIGLTIALLMLIAWYFVTCVYQIHRGNFNEALKRSIVQLVLTLFTVVLLDLS